MHAGQVYVRGAEDCSPCEVAPGATVGDVRKQLRADARRRRLVYKGETLRDGVELCDAGIGAQAVIELATDSCRWDAGWPWPLYTSPSPRDS